MFKRKQPKPRTIEELLYVDNHAWPEIQELIEASEKDITVLPINEEQGMQALYSVQVTPRSYLGGLALNTGGLILDNGWLRILGGGYNGLPDLATASGMNNTKNTLPPPYIVAAYDVMGGTFVVNGGSLPGQPGSVNYMGPDTLEWLDLEIPHSKFIAWAIDGKGLEEFYTELRWNDWEQDIKTLELNQGVYSFPPLSTVEGSDLNKVIKSFVPFHEIQTFYGIG
jgi:hypothetical protein